MRTWPSLVRDLLGDVPRGRLRLALSIVLAAAASGASVALIGVSAWLISKAAEHPPFLDLSVAAVGVRFFGISRGVLRYVERLVGHDLALRMQSALRLRTYDSLSRTTLLGRRKGDLLVRVVADVEAVQDVVVRVVLPFAAAVVVTAGTSAMLARFSPLSASVLLISALVAGLVLPAWAQRASRDADAAAVPLRGRLADEVRELSRTAIDLVAYDADGAALDRIRTTDALLRGAEAKATGVRAAAAGLQVVAAGIAVLAALWFGGHAVVAGDIAPRLLAVLVLTPLALHEAMGGLAQAAQTLTRARSALGRAIAVLDEPAVGRGDALMQPASGTPSLSATDLTIGWPDHEPVARRVNLSVQPGEAVAVVGASGSGKTTLAATLLGLIPSVAGDVRSDGRIGYLAQDAHIFGTSVAENVRIGDKDATADDVREALDAAGLPLDADRVVGELGATLSGGEARRLALSRLLVADPDILILDEPTEHLDRDTASALMDDIWARRHERPIIVLTHDPDVIARCDRVLDLAPPRTR
jgi:thiol reductant ABC exporter CydC subunit